MEESQLFSPQHLLIAGDIKKYIMALFLGGGAGRWDGTGQDIQQFERHAKNPAAAFPLVNTA